MELIQSLPANSLNPKWAVTIERYSKVRSRQQNALYWKWLSLISCYSSFETPVYDDEGFIVRYQKTHPSKDQLHSWFALKYLEPVWISHPETEHEFPVPRSTRSLKIEEFTEYMNKINEYAHEHGITLPTPNELLERQ